MSKSDSSVQNVVRMNIFSTVSSVLCFLTCSYVTGSILVADGGHWLYRDPMVPPDLVAKLSKKLESSTRDIGRASNRSRL